VSPAIARLLLVWAALLGLLATTLGLAYLPLGAFKPFVAYGIATLKAALILWFFMDLRRESGLLRLAAAAGFAWLSVLLILVAGDYLAR
jgi:cytochrome c oxidase subunit 4